MKTNVEAHLPLLSVITPTYNRAALLPAVIRSIQQQTFSDWELVIADDGSTDDTREVVLALARDDHRIRYFYQPNGGVSAARNFGVAQSRGGYLFFIDSDDVLLEGTLQAFASCLRDTAAAVVFSSCEMIRDGVKKIKVPYPQGPAFRNVKGLFLAGAFCLQRELFLKAGGYRTELKFGENFELGLRICQYAVPTTIVDHISVRYTIQSEKRISNALINKVNSNLFILREHEALLKRNRRFHAVILSQTGYLYKALGDRPAARGYFLKSFYANPFNLRNVYRFLSLFL